MGSGDEQQEGPMTVNPLQGSNGDDNEESGDDETPPDVAEPHVTA